MALATKPSIQTEAARSERRIWHAPTSVARWLWLGIAFVFTAVVVVLYVFAITTQPFPGPFNDPLRSFGILAFALVLATAAYSLRRRFARSLPGKVQGWLWMHTWLGVAAILVALMHENFVHILHNFCQNASCLTNAYGGTSALLALIVLVLSGLAGRLLDTLQARRIAREASTNSAGIIGAVEERLLEQEYAIERLCAGKSELFKLYCMEALEIGQAGHTMPVLEPREQADFQQAVAALQVYRELSHSLKSQQQARFLMRTWRIVHITFAVLALLIIIFHATMELLSTVFHLI